MVVAEQATQSLAALDLAGSAADFLAGHGDPVVEPLMISFCVKMDNELANRVSQRCLAEEDHLVETLVFNSFEEPLQVGV